MSIAPPTVQTTSPAVDALLSRNATKVELWIALASGAFARVGRVQSMSESITNNVQVLMELGSQFAVELQKGVTTYSFSIAKFYVQSDVFDQLTSGGIFGLYIADAGNNNAILEMFTQCALTSVSRTYTSGQATVAQNASVVTIGGSQGSPG